MEYFIAGLVVGVFVTGGLTALIHNYITNPEKVKAQVAAAEAEAKKL